MKPSKRRFKKMLAALLSAAVVSSMFPVTDLTAASNKTEAGGLAGKTAKEASTPLNFRDLTADQIVEEMGLGINLGNTMDGHTGLTPVETLWQSTITSQKYVDTLHDAGFNTFRVPVTWGTMIDEETYEIKDQWISRVQDIVDYAISQDMYVIINIHHDGAEGGIGWLELDSDNMDAIKAKYRGTWKTIASYFKDYDEHLVFESMNEVWSGTLGAKKDLVVINELNQIFVDTVRATGSNNANRWLSIPGRYTNIDVNTDPTNGFELPQDSVADRLFVSVHDYPMGMGLTNTMEATKYSVTMATQYAKSIQKLITAFTSKGIPVILGEYGVSDKNNTEEREYYYEVINQYCDVAGVVTCAWDVGEPGLYSMALINRSSCEKIFPTIISAMLRGTYSNQTELAITNIVKPTTESPTVIRKITDLNMSTENVEMVIGDITEIDVDLQPADTNDILVWSTGDTSVATVHNGKIIARGIGSTQITATSNSGSFQKSIPVTVTAETLPVSCKEISSDDAVELKSGDYVRLNAKNATVDSGAYLTYRSSNPSIATVNRLGKIVGISEGDCEIIITASTGLSKVVRVSVGKADVAQEITLSLNIYFASSKYAGEEKGQRVTVNGNGTFALEFDCEKHLSDAAKKAGIEGIEGFGALYLKDANSGYVLDTCNIKYERIILGNQDLTVTQTEPKSAIKNKVFDTNDPINAWDGSQVTEVEVSSDFAVSFPGHSKPQKVIVQFTLSDMWFTGAASAAENTTKTEYSDGAPPSLPDITSGPTETPTESTAPPVSPDVTSAPITTTSPDVTNAPSPSPDTPKTSNVSRGNLNYKLNTNNTAVCIGMKKKTKTVSIPKSITVNNKKYQVTSIAKKAFMKDKKLKQVQLGANIRTIGEKAFFGCSNLKKVIIQSKKLKKIGKKAFGNVASKSKIYVPSAHRKAYKKLLLAKGQNRQVKIFKI